MRRRSPCDIGGAITVGEETVVADAMQSFGQNVDQEAANKLAGAKRHRLVACGAIAAVILVTEGDAIGIDADEAAVGDRDAVGVARQVSEHRLGPGERIFYVDVPFDLARRYEERVLPKQRHREMRALSQDEVARFREKVKGTRHAVLFDFLLGTGCRPGEALAVRWQDLHREAGAVTIQRALTTEEGRTRLPRAKDGRLSAPGSRCRGLLRRR